MTKIEKNIKLLESLLPEEMKQNISNGNNKHEYISMLEIALKSNRLLFITKELFYELNKIGINNPYEMSEYIINTLYSNAKHV